MRYLFIILFCCGCYLPKQAEKDLKKIEKKYPDLIKNKAAELYPLKIKIDSFAVIEWRERINEIIKQRNDTINDTIINTIDCSLLRKKLKDQSAFIDGLQDQLNNIPIIYKVVEDSSKIYLLNNKLNEQKKISNNYQRRATIFIYYGTCISAILILLLLAALIKIYFGSRKKLH
jgi:hypothetical protein